MLPETRAWSGMNRTGSASGRYSDKLTGIRFAELRSPLRISAATPMSSGEIFAFLKKVNWINHVAIHQQIYPQA
jgi:hypothetical protein